MTPRRPRDGQPEDRYKDALDALSHAAREFSTAAAYTVRVDVEDEFLAALDDAERIVGGDHA